MGHATTKVENLQFEFFLSFEIPQLFIFFNFAKSSLFPSFFFIGYIYISLCPLQHSLIANSSSWFFCYVNVIGPFPSMLYSTQTIHKFFMCILFETRSKSSLCPCQLKNLRTERQNLSYPKFSTLPLKPFRIPRYTYLFTHDLTRSPLLSTWVTHVMRMRRVRGTFVQFLRANSFSPWL